VIYCCQYEFCARDFVPAKQGPRQRYCSKKCREDAWYWRYPHRRRLMVLRSVRKMRAKQ